MSETVIVKFRIDGGVITSVMEWTSEYGNGAVLKGRRDIEVAVARVANTPVTSKISEERN